MSTKERLAQALKAENAPEWMVRNAERGHYDDFESELDTPIVQLVRDCQICALKEFEKRVKDGEFDASKEESDAWFEREGKHLFKKENGKWN